jgi:hypothetical protein
MSTAVIAWIEWPIAKPKIIRQSIPAAYESTMKKIWLITGVSRGLGHASAGMEAFSESLSHELAPLGISVSIIEPGAFRTDFLEFTSLRQSERCIEDYAASAGLTRRNLLQMGSLHNQIGDPVRAAEATDFPQADS